VANLLGTRPETVSLGVDIVRYGKRDYGRTQQIGAALAFLEFDGLVAPSARWPCDNLMIFSANHKLTERLDVIDAEEVEWRSWAKENAFLAE
jgi:RES domain